MDFWDKLKQLGGNVVSGAQQVYAPIDKFKADMDQKVRDGVLSQLQNKDVNGISEDDFKTQYLNALQLPNSDANREVLDMRYEPAMMGTVQEVGKGADIAAQLARNIRDEALVYGKAARPNLGYGATTVIDPIKKNLGKIIKLP